MNEEQANVEPLRQWWKPACVYQIYPASYKDSDGDGVGDLPGILSKLDYVKSLGVDAIWISPFFESPDYDMGYDISDYQRPSKAYGTLEDVDAIIKGCHDRGLKILFDLVINHTSHLHKWFRESESSKDNPYRDYYHWRPPRYDADGKRLPPTNWRANFGGSAWTYSEKTDEYYLHLFTPQQPDLNWELPHVRQAIYKEAVLFWLERGVDGFRIDTSALYSKYPFEDVPVVDPFNYDQPSKGVYEYGPKIHEYLTELTEQTFAKYNAVTIAEMGGAADTTLMLDYVGAQAKKYNMAIRFDLVFLDHGNPYYMLHKEAPLSAIKACLVKEQELAEPRLDAWLCNYLENHDQSRSVSRFADDSPEHRVTCAKMLAILLATLSGTLLLYQGQEIGTINMPSSWGMEEYKDPASINFLRDVTKDIKSGQKGVTVQDAEHGLRMIARDHARNPMQWSDAAQAGFSTNPSTWMRVMDSFKDINVASQQSDPQSTLNFYRNILALRKEYAELFVYGKMTMYDVGNDKTMVFSKTVWQQGASQDDRAAVLITLNFSGEEQTFTVPEVLERRYPQRKQLAGTLGKDSATCQLQPWEGRLFLLQR